MSYRFYFWFKGVPENRIGGPWWARDFATLDHMIDFKRAMLPFLYAWVFDDREYLEELDPMNVRPRENLQVSFAHNQEN